MDSHCFTIGWCICSLLTQSTPGGAIEIGLNSSATLGSLSNVKLRLFEFGLLISSLFAIARYFVASAITKPIDELTRTSEEVAITGDLSIQVDINRRDETGRLARSINQMLDSLYRSRLAQARLAQNASHELRTPLTSLRTNIKLLSRYRNILDVDRERILRDLLGETNELFMLVKELLALAGLSYEDEEKSAVDIMNSCEAVASRISSRFNVNIKVRGNSPQVWIIQPRTIERAISNLLENAIKFRDSEETITINLSNFTVALRNFGSSIPIEDLPNIFERFYRAKTSWPITGSGLGLAIVKEAARTNNERVFAKNILDTNDKIGVEIGIKFDSTKITIRLGSNPLSQSLDL